MKSGGVMAKRRGPEPKPDGRRGAQIAFRGRPGDKDRAVRLARKDRTSPSHFIDMALVMFAEEDGFEPPPER